MTTTINTGIAVALLAFAFWAIRRSVHHARHAGDYRTRNDHVQAHRTARVEPRPEPPTPGTDHQLYLDCIAVYGDCDELDRLRAAIHQHRKEKP